MTRRRHPRRLDQLKHNIVIGDADLFVIDDVTDDVIDDVIGDVIGDVTHDVIHMARKSVGPGKMYIAENRHDISQSRN